MSVDVNSVSVDNSKIQTKNNKSVTFKSNPVPQDEVEISSKKKKVSTGAKVGIGLGLAAIIGIGIYKRKSLINLWKKFFGKSSKTSEKIKNALSAVKPKTLDEAVGIKPIKSNEEYNTVLQRLQQNEEWGDNLYGWHKNPLISRQNVQNYPNCQDIEKGVIAYVGYDDIHNALNCYLSGRPLPRNFSKQMGEDFTKLVDYSLKDMDKTFTPYSGITYRFGFFDPKVKQYYSTSKSPKTFPFGNKDGQHTMFVSKRGHDIEAFQKAKNTSATRQRFIDEREVLMDVSADYRELVDLTPELIEKRLEYAKIILTERKEPLTEENIRKIISEIKVYEEI